MIAKCLNCNRDYDQETQGAICPHDVGGPNSLPPWPKSKSRAMEPLVKLSNYLREHQNGIDVRWTAKVIEEAERKYADHLEHVTEFLNEMYATLVDPVEQPVMTVAELCVTLLKTAREQREQLNHTQRLTHD